jgi:CTD nuclear envelope phosphatase 1
VRCPHKNPTYVKETDKARLDNAIPIEGWISDPTDYELLHLIPLLEGLQYVTDVRALLALRQGMPSSA